MSFFGEKLGKSSGKYQQPENQKGEEKELFSYKGGEVVLNDPAKVLDKEWIETIPLEAKELIIKIEEGVKIFGEKDEVVLNENSKLANQLKEAEKDKGEIMAEIESLEEKILREKDFQEFEREEKQEEELKEKLGILSSNIDELKLRHEVVLRRVKKIMEKMEKMQEKLAEAKQEIAKQ